MQHYDQLLALLGKSTDDPGFAEFIDDLGEEPEIDDKSHAWFCNFRQSGIQIVGLSGETGKSKRFYAVMYFIAVPDVRDGHVKSYCGEFVAGVTPDDSMEEVRRKIELKPSDWYADDETKLRYDFPDHILHFHFQEPDGEQMELVSVQVKVASNGQAGAPSHNKKGAS
jgi:hypothetical protein